MENLIVDGAHGGHYSKYLKPSEPLYPCTAVGEKYKAECFDMQTRMRWDGCAVTSPGCSRCARASERRFGRTATRVWGATRDDQSEPVPGTVATCNLGADREQRSHCVLGAVLDFVYYYHSDVQAQQLCAASTRRCSMSAAARPQAVGLF